MEDVKKVSVAARKREIDLFVSHDKEVAACRAYLALADPSMYQPQITVPMASSGAPPGRVVAMSGSPTTTTTPVIPVVHHIAPMRGQSPRNLKYMRAFAAAWPKRPFVLEALAQIPWSHHLALLERCPTSAQAERSAAQGRPALEKTVDSQ